MIAIGAGGLDVAVAMAKRTYSLMVPKIVGVKLTGSLPPWTSAKDVIPKVLQELTVKGGVGKIIEYYGEGVKSLSVTDRATITNMGRNWAATTSVLLSDENTEKYLASQGRPEDYVPLSADEDAVYDENLTIDLSQLKPSGSHASQSRQCGLHRKHRRNQGGSGCHRQLYQLLLCRPDEGSGHLGRQAGSSGRHCHLP